MAVSTTATEYSGVGTGAAATYATGIYANASDQIKVYAGGVLKTLGADYTLNNVGGSAGVNVVGSFTNGAAVYIERVTPITQLVDTQNNETILEDVLDAEFDKLTMIAQETATRLKRAITFPKGEAGFELPAAAARKGLFIGFDAGSGFPVLAPANGGTVQSDSQVLQSDGNTIRANSPLTIWRQRPSLLGGAVAGTASQNAARLQAQINALASAGGGTLRLVEDQIDIDRPLVIPAKVSLIGPGIGRCLLRNVYADTYAAADYRQSPVLQTGNFNTGALNPMWGNGNSKALSAVASGDVAATLVTAGDAAGYAVGDTVLFVSTLAYLDGSSSNLANYMAIRKIVRISGAILYVDRPFTEAFTGFAYNLRTGTLLGAPTTVAGAGLPLYVWGDAEIAGFDVDSVWHWKAGDAACYAGYFSDINVRRSRTIAYGNAHQYCIFDNVGGAFTQVFSELAQNSEQCVVRNFRASHDAAARALAGVPAFFAAITAAENTLDNTFTNGFVDCTGFTGVDPIIKHNNAERLVVRDVTLRCNTPAFAGTVIDIGNGVTTAGRREALNAQYRVIWSGFNRRYLRITNANSGGNVIDGDYRGTPVFEAFLIDGVTSRNTIAPTCFMEQSYGSLMNGAANQVVAGCYVGGGMNALTGATYTTLAANDVRGVRTINSQARRGGTKALLAAVTVSTVEADVLACPVGTGTLQRQDSFDFSFVLNLAGGAGTKTFKIVVDDNTTPASTTMGTVVIPAATTGIVTVSGKLRVVWPGGSIVPEISCSDAGATITRAAVTSDLSAKDVTVRARAVKANAGDTFSVTGGGIELRNPIQN